jgi:hypothetical protein
MIRLTLRTNTSALLKVIRIQSSAMSSDLASGFQANLPKAYQLAWAKGWPHQLMSVPIFATPAIPEKLRFVSDPLITFETVEPSPLL